MRKEEKNKNFARKLQELSMDGDKVSPEKVDGVLQYISKLPYHKAKPILKNYLRYIQRSVNSTNAYVEHAGTLSDSVKNDLIKQLSDYYKVNVELDTEEKSELIAGFRIHIDNDVWDNTVSHHLNALVE